MLKEAASLEVPDVEGAVEPNVITYYTTLFANYVHKEDTTLVQLFPRMGVDDKYFTGVFKPVCAGCGYQFPQPQSKCPRCSNPNKVYQPGRLEQKPDFEFPHNLRLMVRDALELIEYPGDYAVDEVRELNAFVVQLPVAWKRDQVVQFVEALDQSLDG